MNKEDVQNFIIMANNMKKKLTKDHARQLLVKVGTHTKEGQLTEHYK